MSRPFAPVLHEYAISTIWHEPLWFAGPHPVILPGPITQSTFNGTANNDNFTGTSDPDVFFMGDGGKDKVSGAAGNDQIFFDTAFAANDQIDGGADNDILTLEGDYSSGVTFKPATVVNVETIQLAGNFAYDLTLAEETVGAGQSMTITGGPTLVAVDARDDTDAALIKLVGWTGADSFIGSDGTNQLQGRGGADFMDGRGGTDTYIYGAVSESTSLQYDTVRNFDFKANDLFDLWFSVTGTDGSVTTGTLSTETFNEDLADAIDEDHLDANHAVLFRPNAGTLDGEVFLIVDVNGTEGYQIAADLVIHLQGADSLNKFNGADFT